MEEWQRQIQDAVNTLEKLRKFIRVTPDEEKAITTLKTRWGTTPYFASLMDREDPNCPIRRQVVPSMKELENKYGMDGYLAWKEKRHEGRPDCISRQYRDRVAFTVINRCPSYCRFCFRRELTIDDDLELRFDVDKGLDWIKEHESIRDIVFTGGEALLLDDDKIGYLVERSREIPHVDIIRFHTRTPIVLPQRITSALIKVLKGYHRVPIWINIQCNHPKEITEHTARAVYDLTTCGVNVGNQAVLLKGINDDVDTFRELHRKLLSIRVKPYYVFYCEPAPGIDHFRTPVEKGAELIRDALQGHISGLAVPRYVLATNIGKIPINPNYYMVEKTDKDYTLKNYQGMCMTIPRIPE